MKEAQSLILELGHEAENPDSRISCPPEDLFGRHLAVVGATGGGKSWTLAHLIEEASRFKSKIVLLDASGEFYRLNCEVFHACIGRAEHSTEYEVFIRYEELTEGDLFAIFRPSGVGQAPKLRAAVQSLKLARLAPALSADGTIFKAHRIKVEYEKARAQHISRIQNPLAQFDIQHLPLQIQHECVEPQRSPLEPLVWGGPNGKEQSQCMALVDRVQEIIHDPHLKCIFRPSKLPSIFNVIQEFISSSKYKVLRISLKSIPFEHSTREIIGNAIGRHLLLRAREDIFKQNPLVVVIDEAHQFLSRTTRDENEYFPLDSFGLIAKEGRKYALTVCLATQRPRDIPEDILSQTGSYIIHRVTNHLDLSIIERAAGSIDAEAMGRIPYLKPGEAILMTTGLGRLLQIQLNRPQAIPDSQGPDYQNYWR